MKLTEVVRKTPEEKLAIQKAKIAATCENYGIRSYTIRDDLKVDVNGDVLIRKKSFKKLPIQFGKITGYFNIEDNKNLESLEGCPDEVTESFNCSYCSSLTSLRGAPKKVGNMFSCFKCTSLMLFGQKLPNVVNFNCGLCVKLLSLKGSPTRIKEDFICHLCYSLTSFESDTKFIGEDFNARECSAVTTFRGCPDYIGNKITVEDIPKAKNYLALFEIDGLKSVITHDNKLERILNTYLRDDRNIAACQEELIEAGLEEYAEF